MACDLMLRSVCLLKLVVCLITLIFIADIATDDIHNITSRFSKSVYISQEVIYGAGEPITPAQYTQNGKLNSVAYI